MIQAVHWRAETRDIEQAMTLELGHDDRPQAQERLSMSGCLSRQLDVLQQALLAERNQGIPFTPKVRYQPPSHTWDQDGWRALISADACTHMSVARLSQWSDPYEAIPSMDRENPKEFEDLAEFDDPDVAMAHPSANERDGMLAAIQRLRADSLFLSTMSEKLLHAISVIGIGPSPGQAGILAASARSTGNACAPADVSASGRG